MTRLVSRLLSNSAVARWALRSGIRLFVPRHRVGVVGVVWNESGEILLLDHVVRRRYSWGLPGGWVDRGEGPAEALARELREEVGLEVEIGRVLLVERGGMKQGAITPASIAIAFECRVKGGSVDVRPRSREIRDARWVDPVGHGLELLDSHRRAIAGAVEGRS